MNADLLLKHFDRIAEAPDAVARLRRFILDLAVRGKLVEQDPNDEPASELLKRIQVEKERLTPRRQGAKKSEKQDFLGDLASWREMGFEIPGGWEWSYLGLISTKTGSGSTPSGGQSAYQSTGIPFLRSQNIYNEGLRLNAVAFINEATHAKMSGTAIEPGDLLLNITGGSIGRCCRIPDSPIKANISQHVAIIRLAINEMRDYLHKVILSPFFQSFIINEQTGAGREGLPKNRMDRIAVPIPPLAEQHRIVAKVDELMALCDQLEAARKEREARRDSLVAASLHRIGTSSPLPPGEGPGVRGNDDTTFSEAARFHLDHLPRLTTRLDHIKQLRQTILNLAVRGRLVPQDPNDEPASELLKRIRLEKESLTPRRQGAKKNETQDFLGALASWRETAFEIPLNWKWIPLSDVLLSSFYGPRFGAEEYSENGIPTIRTTDMTADGRIVLRNPPKVQIPDSRIDDFKCIKNDLLVTRTGSIGTMAIFRGDYAAIPSAYLIRMRFAAETQVNYLYSVLRSPYGQESLGLNTTKVAQPNINAKNLSAIAIPLPPLPEQHRIVAKVDELMALCDQLEAQLGTTELDSRRLLEAVLRDALAPALEGEAA